MKALSFALLLMASVAFVLVGCSDNSAVPVSPTEQPMPAPGSLQKSNKSTTAFSMNSPKVFVGGEMWENDGKLQIKKFRVLEPVASADTRVAGQMDNLLSLTVDLITGEGPCHGSFTIDPDAIQDGVWEGTYSGYRSMTDNPYAFTLPLKGVAHGKGGDIDKMQLFIEITLTVYTALPGVPRPPIPLQAPIHWAGTGVGTIMEH